MDKRIVSLVGALSAFAIPEAVQATPATTANANDVLRVQSYAELLDPIPNAAALLRAVDAAPPPESGSVQLAQYGGDYSYHHHHHHHHHHYRYRRPYPYPYPYYHHHRHHHHHHHHHGYYQPY